MEAIDLASSYTSLEDRSQSTITTLGTSSCFLVEV